MPPYHDDTESSPATSENPTHTTAPGEVVGTGWFPCSAESHLDSIAFYDAVDRDGVRHPAELHVRFRREGSHYAYLDHDNHKLYRIFEAMRTSDHPGKVLWAELIRPKVAYHRVS